MKFTYPQYGDSTISLGGSYKKIDFETAGSWFAFTNVCFTFRLTTTVSGDIEVAVEPVTPAADQLAIS